VDASRHSVISTYSEYANTVMAVHATASAACSHSTPARRGAPGTPIAVARPSVVVVQMDSEPECRRDPTEEAAARTAAAIQWQVVLSRSRDDRWLILADLVCSWGAVCGFSIGHPMVRCIAKVSVLCARSIPVGYLPVMME